MNLTRGRKTRLLGMLAILTAWTLHPGHGRAADPFDQTHAEFQRVLVASATPGGVDYAHLKRSPDLLNSYLLRIASLDAAEFASWDRRDRLALLINLYNATTLRVVRDHFPVASIREIGLLPGAAWRENSVRWFGNAISLDHLEHKILRPEYQEPRIHFALVCAARGCPPLRLEPYRGQDLERQLDEQARAFLAQPEKNRFDPQTSTLWLSPIFKWYTRDFAGSEETLAAYARPFLPASARTQLDLARKVQIQFTDYDWNLNNAPH